MRTRILLVEDEPTISEPLAESLGRDGFEADVAATLAGAREAFRRDAPYLVLLDVILPDGDGRDLAREIRKESDVPIVMLTARGDDDQGDNSSPVGENSGPGSLRSGSGS